MLYKIIKNHDSEKKDRFVPHLFQQLDVNSSFTCREEKGFEPIGLDENRSSSVEPQKEDIESETLFEDTAESAYADGFVKGEADGFLKGEKAGAESERRRLQTVFDAFEKAVTELEKQREALYLNAERGAVELALAIAEKIVSREISVNREVLSSVLKKALERAMDQRKIKIRINKSDLQSLNESEYSLSELTKTARDVVIEGDDAISRGGCVIETDFGSIDARIESQLEAIGELLRSEMP